MFYEQDKRDHTLLPHDPWKALVAPRPIGWVTTRSAAGLINLAPYSFFNGFSSQPPIIGFSSEGAKDSVTFAEETGEFVFNVATFDLKDAMNATSATLPRGSNEFLHAGLEMAPSRLVAPPRVKASPAALECKVVDIVRIKGLDGQGGAARLVLGQIVGVYIEDRFVRGGRVDTASMRAIARCGYGDYAVVDSLFELKRPA